LSQPDNQSSCQSLIEIAHGEETKGITPACKLIPLSGEKQHQELANGIGEVGLRNHPALLNDKASDAEPIGGL